VSFFDVETGKPIHSWRLSSDHSVDWLEWASYDDKMDSKVPTFCSKFILLT